MDVGSDRGDQLVEKLDSVGLQKSRPSSEGSYDYIEEKGDTMERPVESTISISTAEQWEKQLLQDPKVVPSLQFQALR